MKTTLRLLLPRLTELHPDTEIEFAITEGMRLSRQGRLPLRAIAAATPAGEAVAILHPADAVVAELPLPPLPAHQLDAALQNAIEPLVLGDADTLAAACGPRRVDGRVTAAWADRAALTRGWALLADHGLVVHRLVPAPLALPRPPHGILAAWRDHHLLVRDANGHGATLALDPLDDDSNADPAALFWLETLLEAAPTLTVLPPAPPWLLQWQPPLPAERSASPDPSQAWLGPLPEWSLALPALRPRQLQASPWRKPLAWVTAAAAIWLIGLNGYAWQLAGEARAIEQRMLSQVRTAFPQLPVILDPLRQATQQRDALRSSQGQTSQEDFLPLALAAAQLIPAGSQSIESLDYHDGTLTLGFAGSASATGRQALGAEVMSRAQQLGLQVDDVDGQWEIRLRDPGASPGANGGGVAITPSAQTARDLNRRTGGSR